MKIPRKSKKRFKKNGTLIYDLASIPNGKKLFDILNEFHNYGIVVWCSAAFGNLGRKDISTPPQVINNIRSYKLIDTSK